MEEIAAAMRARIEALLPGIAETVKYGGTLYHPPGGKPEDGVCGVFAYTAHVSLIFPRGVDLDDPAGLLQGKGKFRRHLKLTSLADIEAPAVEAFILAAARGL